MSLHVGELIVIFAAHNCDNWRSWAEVLNSSPEDSQSVDYAVYIAFVVLFSTSACWLTLVSRTVVPSAINLATLDENLGADRLKRIHDGDTDILKQGMSSDDQNENPAAPPVIYYSAAGSGVAEVKVILSGFVLHGYDIGLYRWSAIT